MARWRPRYVLRDAALAYASRGIPVLPLHHPVAHLQGARPVPAGQPLDTLDLPPGGGHRGYAAMVDGSGLMVACCCSHSIGGR
jgi:hypothetical protein